MMNERLLLPAAVMALTLVATACTQATYDDTVDLFTDVIPQTAICNEDPYSAECAATDLGKRRLEKEARAARLEAIHDTKDRSQVEWAVTIRPDNPANKQTRAAFDVAEGKEPSIEDLAAFQCDKFEGCAYNAMAQEYIYLWAHYEDSAPERARLAAAYCIVLDSAERAGVPRLDRWGAAYKRADLCG